MRLPLRRLVPEGVEFRGPMPDFPKQRIPITTGRRQLGEHAPHFTKPSFGPGDSANELFPGQVMRLAPEIENRILLVGALQDNAMLGEDNPVQMPLLGSRQIIAGVQHVQRVASACDSQNGVYGSPVPRGHGRFGDRRGALGFRSSRD